MSVLDMIGAVLIGPLKLLFEVIFSIASHIIGSAGPAIIVLSLAMNVLVLPLYRRADAIQVEARDTENKLKDVVAHIKKTFSGDERAMILQTYYRQNNYSPLSALSGSISLLLEIPFFMAAYQFLSGLDVLRGVSFGPIADLSAPDGLLVLGGLSINLLPLLMTLVNVISSTLYLKGFPLKTKIQLYGMAVFFLVFLYNSPSGLVFYWTLNNTFSLVKTLFYRIKNPRRILNILVGAAGVGLILASGTVHDPNYTGFVVFVGLVMQLFWLLPLLKEKLPKAKDTRQSPQPNTKLFVLGGLFLTALIGLLIPSTYISASPQEYIDPNWFYAPVWYVVQTLCICAGTFLVWMGVFYWLATPSGKVLFTRIVWTASGVMLVNYMFFGTGLGIVSPNLQYADRFYFTVAEHLINIAVALALIKVLHLIFTKFQRRLPLVLLVGSIALTSMSVINITQIADATTETLDQLGESTDQHPSFRLSKDGQNVVVIMLDRGIGPFIPYIMEEKPELLEQFDGFTYYSNTLSFGAYTNFGAPALYGGYDYTPVNMNLRDTELLVDKHNEALKVVPTLLSGEGYNVTVIDPSYAGYKWIPDISIYDDIPNVNTYIAEGKFDGVSASIDTVNARNRNFFLFSLMKTLPVSLQASVYNDGLYHSIPNNKDTNDVSAGFMRSYNVLDNMDTMTTISEEEENTYMFLRSNITHEPVVLQEPYYEPSSTVDNSAYYPQEDKTITDGETSFLLSDEHTLSHYHANVAALMLLGEWFDYLRDSGVYDNTRIILVSDHGRDLGLFDDDPDPLRRTEYYRPMLLVKDFNATGFTTSDAFMTNGDVPTLTLDGLIDSPVNPFTGNPINSNYKLENDKHHVLISRKWDVNENNGTQFLEDLWATVSGNVGEKENWTYHSDPAVLPPDLND